MSNNQRQWLKTVFSAAALGMTAVPAMAFFPPITAPISRPVTVTVNPTPVDPVKVPPVETCVKPKPKPRPTQQNCGCTDPGVSTANTPEPATLVSAGIGFAVAGVAGWIKKRRKNNV